MKTTALSFAALALLANVALADTHPHWAYSGEGGPDQWGKLSTEFSSCESGRSESPVDITTAKKVPADYQRVKFNYQPLPVDVVNTGHAIQFNAKPSVDMVSLGGHDYKLVQLHFHSPGEERFAGQASPMDAHLVHADEDGKLLVIAVQFVVAKEPNWALQTLLQMAPASAGAETKVESVLVNPAGLLPELRGYFTYSGSLTTPPCSEGVTWIELKQPVSIAQNQLDEMHRFYNGNQRPVQPLNDRTIYDVE